MAAFLALAPAGARRPAGTGEVAAIAGKTAATHPQLIRAVLALALAEDPADRYQTAGAFADALEAAARGEEVAPRAEAEPPAPRARGAAAATSAPRGRRGVEGRRGGEPDTDECASRASKDAMAQVKTATARVASD